jgi:capsular exopolysaccharide synthesis family protein
MTDSHSLVSNQKTERDAFVFAEPRTAIIETEEDQISIVQFWRVLQKRRWIVLCSLVAITLFVAIVSSLMPKRYDATARILLDLEGPDGLALEQAALPMGLDINTKLETQIRIVQSDTIANSVIKQLQLHRNKAFGGMLAELAPKDFDTLRPEQRVRLVEHLHRSLTVQLIPKTEIIEIHFRSKDPALAADITNSVATTYIEHNFQTKYRSTLQTADWLTKQLDDLKTKAESAQEQLIAYQKRTGIIGTDETHNIIIDKLGELNKELSQAEGDRILKEAKFRIATTENPELIANIAPESVLSAFYTRRLEVRAEYAQLAAKYGPAYPRVIQLQSQMRELDSAVGDEMTKVGQAVQAEYKAALKSEEMLKNSFDKQKQEAYKLNEDAIQYAIMRRDVESSRDLYEGLLKKLKEAGIMAGLKSSNINIIDPASVPIDPVEPKIPLNIALGCMGGLLFGMALAFVVENVDTSIRTPADVENYCFLPSLGVIPKVAVIQTTHVVQKHLGAAGPKGFIPPVAMERRNSGAAEAFRALRTSLLLSSPGAPPQVILVTSAIMQEGKTFTALNLAVVLAQTGQSVLLVDCDMRRPAVNKYLGIQMNAGLSACLAGTEDPDAVVLDVVEVPGLHIVTAGHMPPYPSEMLASDAMPALIHHWRQKFRYIIVDTPPVLAVTDAVVCSGISDVVVLIARSEQTGRQSLLRARDLLRKVRANIAGVVVNGLSYSSVDYRQYYGYYGSNYQNYYHHSANENGNAKSSEID